MTQANKLNKAAMDGLMLALVTIVLTLISGVAGSASLLIWVIKLAATICTLLYFMKRFSRTNAAEVGETTYGQAFTYGFLVSLCSAIICAVYTFISLKYLFPEQLAQTLELVRERVASTPQADMATFDGIFNNFEVFSMIALLFWYTLLGLIYSAIMAAACKVTNNFPQSGTNADTIA